MNWLIVKRLRVTRLISLSNVCLGVVLEYNFVYKYKPYAATNKCFRTYADTKALV